MERQPTWADPILDQYESGIDLAQLDARLGLTPEQRLERLQQFLEFLEDFSHDELPPPALSPE